ncbi:MAG: (2Fe-2S)-binding protein [Ignavibacteriae bacterium]|nr:(2Fe-2S)-binding protein [Ignavibacteriota bacterium]
MVTITLDGKQLEVDGKRTIIEAAREHGIEIPHFCWHPKLSVAGNCRICLVEVEKLPKLVIACATQVADGMVVHTNTPKVVNAREAVMEFLLINHPLDCPICDEAGECKLQDYAYKLSVGYSRFDENKVHKPKRVALGPHVMLDTERCIMCSRCVRFCEEIAHKPQLTFSQRGDHVELTTFPGEQLDNPYSMNTIDICPVGALTSRDFRFKARVWEMSATETVCPGCARGCNMYSWVRNNEILRQTPRFNPEVNEYWMCDAGRLGTFKHVNSDGRIKAPLMKKDAGVVEVGWDEAISRVVSEIRTFRKNFAAIGSAYATNEDNYLFQKFAREVLGTKHIDFMRHVVEGEQDDILLREDKTPNSLGAVEVGVRPKDGGLSFDGIVKAIKERQIKAMYIIDDNVAINPTVAAALQKLEFLVVNSSLENETTRLADVVLPSSTFAERHGTFTNFQGRVQRIRPSVATLEQDRALDGFAMSRLDAFGTPHDRWAKGVKRDARPTWRIIAAIASAMGTKYKYNTSEDVFNELASTVGSFKGMSYRKLGSWGMKLKAGVAVPA